MSVKKNDGTVIKIISIAGGRLWARPYWAEMTDSELQNAINNGFIERTIGGSPSYIVSYSENSTNYKISYDDNNRPHFYKKALSLSSRVARIEKIDDNGTWRKMTIEEIKQAIDCGLIEEVEGVFYKIKGRESYIEHRAFARSTTDNIQTIDSKISLIKSEVIENEIHEYTKSTITKANIRTKVLEKFYTDEELYSDV